MKKLLLISLAAFVFAGCKKENADYFVPYQNHPLNDTAWAINVPATAAVNQLPSLLSKPAVYDSFSAATGAGVHLSDLDINVPQNTCIFADGTQVSGIVRLEIKQLKHKGDFIRNACPTTSFGQLLETGGAFNIKATNSGQQVFIRSGKKVGLVYKDASPASNMSVFYALENPQPPLAEGTNPLFTWFQSDDLSRVTTFSLGTMTGYSIMTGRFNWNNCSRLIDTSLPKTFVTALLPANFTNVNTTVYAVMKQQKTVVQLIGERSSKTFYAPNIPLHSDIILVSLTLLGNTLYMGTKEVTVTKDLIISVNPAIKNAEAIGHFLDSL